MLVIGQTESSHGSKLLTLIINSSAYLAESSIRHWRMVARFRSSKCIASTHPIAATHISKQYILYYVGPIVSILSATVLLVVGCVFSKSLWSDRITSCINLLLFIAIIVYNSLTSGTVPWMGSASNSNTSTMKGYVTYCSNYSDSLMSNRCCK